MSGSLATWPNMAFWPLAIWSDTGGRPVCEATALLPLPLHPLFLTPNQQCQSTDHSTALITQQQLPNDTMPQNSRYSPCNSSSLTSLDMKQSHQHLQDDHSAHTLKFPNPSRHSYPHCVTSILFLLCYQYTINNTAKCPRRLHKQKNPIQGPQQPGY